MHQNPFEHVVEHDAEQLKQLLLLFFNTSFHSILITGPDISHPEILYANPAFCRMTGYTLEELRGKSPKIFQGEKTNRKVIRRLVKNLRDGESFFGATTNYRKDGSTYPVEWNISPLKNSQGKVLFYISIQKDLTNLKAVTSRLKRTNDHFRKMLVELSHEGEQPDSLTGPANFSEASMLVMDNARLFSPALRSDDKITFFEDTEFFEFNDADAGVLVDTEPKPKISAVEYAGKQGSSLNTEDMRAILVDIRDTLFILEEQVATESKTWQETLYLDIYDLANAIFLQDEFVDLSTALSELAIKLRDSGQERLSADATEILLALVSDMEQWLISVFDEKTTDDIHNFDASIVMSINLLIKQL